MLCSRKDMFSLLLVVASQVIFKSTAQLTQIDSKREFKSFFVTNALDESEDYFVSDKLFALVGVEMVDFRNELMSQNLFLIKSYW